jgi:hypothetical protein
MPSIRQHCRAFTGAMDVSIHASDVVVGELV